jgi:hypothetical protein
MIRRRAAEFILIGKISRRDARIFLSRKMERPTPPQRITTAAALGPLVRARRKALGLRQADAAALCDVSPRLLGELERGRATVGFGLVLQVLATLGLDVVITPRGAG